MNVDFVWYFLVAVIILWETYRDIRTQKIDQRHIYLIFGYTLFLAVYHGTNLLEILGFALASAVFTVASRNTLARGDQLTMYALLFGHWKTGTLLWFILSFMAVTLTFVAGRKILKKTDPAPAMPLITTAHLVTLPLLF